MSIEVSSLSKVLDTIAAKASTPPERQHRMSLINPDSSEPKLVARVQRLSTLLGADDDKRWQRFLDLYHLDQQQLMSFLASPTEMLIQHPDWIEVLERIVTAFTSNTSQPENGLVLDRALQPENPIPFEEVLLPFIHYARQQYRQQTSMLPPSLLSDQAQTMMERWLLQKLSQLAREAFYQEFSLFRSQHALWGFSSTQRGLYHAFLNQYRGEGLLSFFQEYSVLARLLIMVVEQWIDTCTEFVKRLAADLNEIEQVFSLPHPLVPVIHLEIGDSDPHHQGRVVFLLEFVGGLKLVYKPRCLAVDQAFFDLLLWCNTHGLSPSLKTLRTLNRSTYSWMEYAEHTSCTTQQEVKNYYVRAGMLLCLLHVLKGTDMHSTNLIACGEHPVFIDLETVIYPGFPPQLSSKNRSDLSPLSDELDQPWHSVLLPGFLPNLTSHGDPNHACDMSGLGGVDGHLSLHPHRLWTHINTDAMSQENVQLPKPISFNTVLLQDTPVTPFAYAEEVATGFRTLYHFLARHSSEISASEGPLAAFENCPIRFIRRGTSVYWNFLTVLAQPEFLRDGTDRWIELQLFKQEGLTMHADPSLLEIARMEVYALERLNIPWFSTSPESRDLHMETGTTILNLFSRSALERTRSCLARLDEADLAQQTELIRSTFLVARPMEVDVQETLPPLPDELEGLETLSADDLVEVVHQIAQELQARAILEMREEGTWIGLKYSDSPRSFSVQPIGFSLYEGVCGIAFFLAALDSITQRNEYRDLVALALQPLCRDLASSASSPHSMKGWSTGLAAGLGSFMYALIHIGTWLQLPEVCVAASHAAQLLTSEFIQADQSFDIMGGNAGAILGLLSLYESTGEPQLIEQAIQCGDFLLTQRMATDRGARSWPTLQKQPLTGFSHGAAGIAYALLRLSTLTGQQTYREAAEEAIAFEQQVFIPEVGNWPDLRKTDHPQETALCGMSWCHGAPGIGLARLGGLASLATPLMHSDLSTALTTTQTLGLPTLDSLCCGNCGRIELLLATSQRLHQPQLRQMAFQWSSVLIHRARKHGGFHLLAQLPRQAYNPGLFQGSAGIGYELLRVAFPERVPSLLLWE